MSLYNLPGPPRRRIIVADKRMVELNGQWFDLKAVVHWWKGKNSEENEYYLNLIFEGNKETYNICIGDKEKTKQFIDFLEDLIETKYYTYRFEFKPPKPPKPKEKNSKSSSKEKKKQTHYLDDVDIPEK